MDEHLQRDLDTRVSESVRMFRSALVPLYSHKGKRPDLVGTAVAVAAGPHRLLFTAAHVIRDFEGDTMVTSRDDGWAELEGEAYTASTDGWQDPEDDRIDAGVVVLTEASAVNWHGWLQPKLLLPFAPTSNGDWFILLGFPRSKVRYNFEKQSVGHRALSLLAKSIATKEYLACKAEHEKHIVLDFNREKAIQGGERITAPSVRGVSGGMLLWAPGIATKRRVSETRLAAIFIEWPSPKRVLISTRVGVHLELLRRTRPDIVMHFDATSS